MGGTCGWVLKRRFSSPLCMSDPSPLVSPPSLPPASSINGTLPDCFGPDCAEPALFIVTLVLLSLLCVCANFYCWRQRGIGVCGIISLCPGRFAGETLAMLSVDNNEVRPCAQNSADKRRVD